MRQPSLFKWIIALAATALLNFGVGARAQTPSLIADHFPLTLTQTQALTRAEEALRAAGLITYPPTAISRGAHNTFLSVLIHCIGNGKTTLVDLEVAANGHTDECEAMRTFLSDFMKTGKTSAGTGFSGEWDTVSLVGGQSYKMKFLQKGNRVTASYENGGTKGSLEGTMNGNVLRFHWTQTNGNKGAGKFTLAADGKTFKGFWTYEDDPDKADKAWNGTRIGAPPPSGAGPS
ncbi:MAG: hypothetical protein JWN14_3658 [Chthonomonadales bacterium]|nr:hypothetical protein [Chthonomonadales bacterium]